jgi:hypothetical protein
MRHLDQLITAYDSATEMGITCPAAYATEAQRFFQKHELLLGEPREESPPRAATLTSDSVVRLPMVMSSDDAKKELQKLQNLVLKFREYVQREVDRGPMKESHLQE